MSRAIREQILHSRMEQKRNRIKIPLIALVVLLIVLGVIFNIVYSYKPPSHDSRALIGMPKPDESFMYGTGTSKFDYYFKMAGNLYQQENGDLFVYFTNPESNDVLLRMEIIDQATDRVLYSTGYIAPGEYIEKLHENVPNEYFDVVTKIYGYTEEFTSAGTTEVQMKLQPW